MRACKASWRVCVYRQLMTLSPFSDAHRGSDVPAVRGAHVHLRSAIKFVKIAAHYPITIVSLERRSVLNKFVIVFAFLCVCVSW